MKIFAVSGGAPGLPQVDLADDQDLVLRSGRVPGPLGRRGAEHLLPLQRLDGGGAGGDGGGAAR